MVLCEFDHPLNVLVDEPGKGGGVRHERISVQNCTPSL